MRDALPVPAFILDLIREGNFRQALECLAELENHPRVNFFRGVCLRQLNRPFEAMNAYLEAVKVNPDYYQAWINLGAVYRVLLEWEKAKEALDKASVLHPDSVVIDYNYGVLWIQSEQREKFNDILQSLKTKDLEYAKLLEEFAANYDRSE